MKKRSFVSNRKIFFIIIAVLAFVLRFYKLGYVPLSLSWDEVSLGYNAYSILTTGRDEHGKWYPLVAFEAYGDYKPPLYIYATVPFVALFGLNDEYLKDKKPIDAYYIKCAFEFLQKFERGYKKGAIQELAYL